MKLFIAIGGVVVALLMAALVAPYFIDWTAYRTAFETEAERILGHPVKVRGEASARLLPLPQPDIHRCDNWARGCGAGFRNAG